MSEPDIAAVLKISRTTLRKAYKAELAQGSVEKRADMLAKLFKTGMAGNVAAQKEFLRRSDLAAAEEMMLGARQPTRPAVVGKKAQAAQDAEHAADGSDWAGDLDVNVPTSRSVN